MNQRTEPPVTRILIGALGGEGGGVLMNWIVAAARDANYIVQATSVPGVAQRTGSTSYYIEIADPQECVAPVLGLVPMPGRVDIVVASELIEAARAIDAGFVSPDRTTLIASSSRVYATTEKIVAGDGRFSTDNIRRAAQELSRECFLLDLEKLAAGHSTFISATMFGSLAASGALPWDASVSKKALGNPAAAGASIAGFEASMAAVNNLKEGKPDGIAPDQTSTPATTDPVANFHPDISDVVSLGFARCVDFQDEAYGELYLERMRGLVATCASGNEENDALREAARRLALWMAYEDVARVADLKTRPERFERLAKETQATPDQIVLISEYLKPRPQEIADMMPMGIGRWISARVDSGKGLPLLGRGVRVRSNGIVGFMGLRMVAKMKRWRRRSWRYHHEQIEIESWLEALGESLGRSPAFARALAELPRVLKGYSDTHLRGKAAYRSIFNDIVLPAVSNGSQGSCAENLAGAVAAALSRESGVAGNQTIANRPARSVGGIEVQLR